MNFTKGIITRIIELVCKYNLQSISEIAKARRISKLWKEVIENLYDRIKSISVMQQKLCDLFKYNENVYDGFNYRRQVIKKSIISNKKHYLALRMASIILMEVSPEYNIPIQRVYKSTKLPDEYYTFLHVYQIYPSPTVRLYPAFVMANVLQTQKETIKQMMLHGYASNNIILFVPICYSKHFRRRYSDNQYITVLCYVNSMNQQIYRDAQSRFITITLNIKDLENNEEHYTELKNIISYKTEAISQSTHTMFLPENVVEECSDFYNVMKVLISNQNFNL